MTVPIHIDLPMAEVCVARIRRDGNGRTSYWVPQGEVIIVIECQDGLMVILREKK